jgi:hypothetical protein
MARVQRERIGLPAQQVPGAGIRAAPTTEETAETSRDLGLLEERRGQAPLPRGAAGAGPDHWARFVFTSPASASCYRIQDAALRVRQRLWVVAQFHCNFG